MSDQGYLEVGNAYMPVLDIRQMQARRRALAEFVAESMREGIDYGVIPGTRDRKTLLKPGAEKLTTLFGLSVRFRLIEKVEDWTGEQHGGEPFFAYWFRCSLWRGDLHIAEADGSCNSWESHYRWRKAERVCPQCGQSAIIAGKKEYGGGWFCWRQRGGCGAKYAVDDARITGQPQGRVPNSDPADVVNTVLKMAQKRALVAAVLLAVNASDYFTQDMDDDVAIDDEVVESVAEPMPRESVPALAAQAQQASAEPPQPAKSGGAKQPLHWIDAVDTQGRPVRNRFWAWTSERGLAQKDVYTALGVASIHEYTGTMADARKTIENWINEQVRRGQMTEAEAVGL